MKFASVMVGTCLLIAPNLCTAAAPASQPSAPGLPRALPPEGGRNGHLYRSHAPADMLVKQFELLAPKGSPVSVRVNSPDTVEVFGTPEECQKAGLLLQQLDDLATRATQLTMAFVLKNARAGEVAESLQRLLSSREVILTVDQRTNRILAVATEAQLKRAQELVQMLDIPATDTDSPPVRVFPVRNAKLDALRDPLRLLMPGQGGGYGGQMWGVFAIDPAGRQVIVQGSPQMLQQVEELLSKLDVPPVQTQPAEPSGSLQIRLIWLSTLPDHPAPADLGDVMAELKKMDIRELFLVTQTIIPAVIGQDFRITGAANQNRPVELKVDGQVINSADRSAPLLQLRLNVRGETEASVRGQKTSAVPMPKIIGDLVNLQTTVVAPLGQSVVLGVSAQPEYQDVFVLQVREVRK